MCVCWYGYVRTHAELFFSVHFFLNGQASFVFHFALLASNCFSLAGPPLVIFDIHIVEVFLGLESTVPAWKVFRLFLFRFLCFTRFTRECLLHLAFIRKNISRVEVHFRRGVTAVTGNYFFGRFLFTVSAFRLQSATHRPADRFLIKLGFAFGFFTRAACHRPLGGHRRRAW